MKYILTIIALVYLNILTAQIIKSKTSINNLIIGEQQVLQNHFKNTNDVVKETNDVCNHIQPSNIDVIAGVVIDDSEYIVCANDFNIEPNTQFLIDALEVYLWSDGGINNVDLIFRNDILNTPGRIITEILNITPDSQQIISTNIYEGLDQYKCTIDLSTSPIALEGNQFGSKYWIQIIARPNTTNTEVIWEHRNSDHIGEPGYADLIPNVLSQWQSLLYYDGAFSLTGNCTDRSTINSAFTANNQNSKFGKFDINNPSLFNVKSTSTATNFVNAGAISTIQPLTAYILDEQGDFYRISIESGEHTFLGNIPQINDQWTGLEFDSTTGTLYAISKTVLATINTDTLIATMVGNTGLSNAAAIAINGNGDLFALDIDDDNFYSINKNTGVATLIGPIGFDASLGQGMAWDFNTDTIYVSAFNNDILDSEWRSVNILTGQTTLLGQMDTSSTSQHAWVSFKSDEILPSCNNQYETFGITDESYTLIQFSLDCDDLPSLIPIEVTSTGIIGDDVTFDNIQIFARHPYSNQMTFSLISPSGTEMLLATKYGLLANSNIYEYTTFKDNAPSIETATFPFGYGPYAPEGGVFETIFDGESITGDWMLKICDDIYSADSYYPDLGIIDLATISFCNENTNNINENSINFSFYPNPVKDKLFYETLNKIESISIFNYLGQKIEKTFEITDTYIDLSSLNSGIYHIQVLTDKKMASSYKVIKI